LHAERPIEQVWVEIASALRGLEAA
jgi:hypothetical protein